MKKILFPVIVTVIVIVLSACTADSYTYSSYPCYLVFRNEIHMDPTLASAMNAASPGVFCQISENKKHTGYDFKTNQGLTSSVNFNAEDQKVTRDLGMNNGLIVGFGTISQQFLAFDHECPNCFDPEAIPVKDKPLTMTQQGYAYCPVCRDSFDMNNGGVCTNDKGRLTQYRCSTTGPYGVLSVGN